MGCTSSALMEQLLSALSLKSNMESILVNFANGVKHIKLNRPQVFNSFNKEMALRFQAELEEAKDNDEVRCVLISGEGKAFCAGQDLAEIMDPEGPELKSIVRDHYNPIVRQITALPKPVVAAVNGVAAGAGANIALACDVVLARKSASFIQAFSKIGLIPDSGGTFFLPRLVGFQKALAITMLGDKISAEEAEKMGMIYRVLEDDAFEDDALNLSEKLANMPTKGLALTKAAYHKSLTSGLNEQLDLEEEFQWQAGQTEDYTEGVNAFLEKRQAIFKGK